MIAVCFSCAIITFPEFFEFKTFYQWDPITNLTSLKLSRTAFGMRHSYQWGYNYTIQALFTILPLICLSIFNTLLIDVIYKAAQNRKRMSGGSVVCRDKNDKRNKEQHKITLMLIIVVIVFFLCQLPQASLNMYVTYLTVTESGQPHHGPIVIICANVFNLLVMINASTNFILYSSFSNRFRRTFKQLFCKFVKQKDTKYLYTDTDMSRSQIAMQTCTTRTDTYSRLSVADPMNSRRCSSNSVQLPESQEYRKLSTSSTCPGQPITCDTSLL